jgi:hypothetical protein
LESFPAPGEPGGAVPKGTAYEIKWDSMSAGPTVRIDASLNGGAKITPVAAAAPNVDGHNTYRVTVPLVDSANCYLRIRSNGVSGVQDIEGPFTVGSPPPPAR